MQQQQQTIHQFQLHKSPAATAILAADSQRPFNPNTIKQQILAKRKLEHPPPPPLTDNLPDPTSLAAGAATKSAQPNQPSRADIQEYMKQQIKRRHKEVMQQKLAEAKQKEEIKKRLEGLQDFRRKQATVQQQHLQIHQLQESKRADVEPADQTGISPHEYLEQQLLKNEETSRPLYENSSLSTTVMNATIPSSLTISMDQQLQELDDLHNTIMQSAPSAEDPTIQRVHSVDEDSLSQPMKRTAPSSTTSSRSPSRAPSQPSQLPKSADTAEMMVLQDILRKALEINTRLKQNNLPMSAILKSPPLDPDTSFGNINDKGFFFQQSQQQSQQQVPSTTTSPTRKNYASEAYPRSPSPNTLGFQTLMDQQRRRSPSPHSVPASRRDSLDSFGAGMVAGFAASERLRSLSRPRVRRYGAAETRAAITIQRWFREQYEVLRRRRVLERRRREEDEERRVEERWRVDEDDEAGRGFLYKKIGTKEASDPYSVLNVLERVKPGFGEEVVRAAREASKGTQQRRRVVPERKRSQEEEDMVLVVGGVAGVGEVVGSTETLKTVEFTDDYMVDEVEKQAKVDELEGMDVDGDEVEEEGRYSETFEDVSSFAAPQTFEDASSFTAPPQALEEPRQSHGPVQARVSFVAEETVSAMSEPQSSTKPMKEVGTDPVFLSTSSFETVSSTSDIYDSEFDSETESNQQYPLPRQYHHHHQQQRDRQPVGGDPRRDELHGLSPRSLSRKLENELKHIDVLDMASEQIAELQRTHLMSQNQQEQFGLTHLLREAKHEQHLKDLEHARRARELQELRLRNLPTQAVPDMAPAAGPFMATSTPIKPQQSYDYAREDFDIVSDFVSAQPSVAPAMEPMDTYSTSEVPSAVSSFGAEKSHLGSISENIAPTSIQPSQDASMVLDESVIDLEAMLDRENLRIPETEEDYLAALDKRLELAQEYATRELKMEKERLNRLGLSGSERREGYDRFKKMILMKFAIEKADIERARREFLSTQNIKKRSSLTDSEQSFRDKSIRLIGKESAVPVSSELQPSKKQQQQQSQVQFQNQLREPSFSTSSIPEEVRDDKETGASYSSISEEIDVARHPDTNTSSDSISEILDAVESEKESGLATPRPKSVTPTRTNIASSISSYGGTTSSKSSSKPSSSEEESSSSKQEVSSSRSTVTSIVGKLQQVSAYVNQLGDLERKKSRLEKSKAVGEMILGEAEKKVQLASDVFLLETQVNGIVEQLNEIVKKGDELAEMKKKAALKKTAEVAVKKETHVPVATPKESVDTKMQNTVSAKSGDYEIEEDFNYTETSAAESIPMEIEADMASHASSMKSIAESIQLEVEQIRQSITKHANDDADGIPEIIDSVQSDMKSFLDDISSFGGSVASSRKKTPPDVVSSVSSYGGTSSKAALDVVSKAAESVAAEYGYDEDFEGPNQSVVENEPSADEESIEAIERLQRLQLQLEEKEAKVKALMLKKKEKAKAVKTVRRKQEEEALLKKIQDLDTVIYRTELEIEEPVEVPPDLVAKVISNVAPAKVSSDVKPTTPHPTNVKLDEIIEDIQAATSADISSYGETTSHSISVAKPIEVEQSVPKTASSIDDISSYGGSISSSKSVPLLPKEVPKEINVQESGDYEDDFTKDEVSVREPVSLHSEVKAVVSELQPVPLVEDILQISNEIPEDIVEDIQEDIEYADDFSSEKESSERISKAEVSIIQPVSVATKEPEAAVIEDESSKLFISTMDTTQITTPPGVPQNTHDMHEDIVADIEEEIEYEDDFSSEKLSPDEKSAINQEEVEMGQTPEVKLDVQRGHEVSEEASNILLKAKDDISEALGIAEEIEEEIITESCDVASQDNVVKEQEIHIPEPLLSVATPDPDTDDDGMSFISSVAIKEALSPKAIHQTESVTDNILNEAVEDSINVVLSIHSYMDAMEPQAKAVEETEVEVISAKEPVEVKKPVLSLAEQADAIANSLFKDLLLELDDAVMAAQLPIAKKQDSISQNTDLESQTLKPSTKKELPVLDTGSLEKLAISTNRTSSIVEPSTIVDLGSAMDSILSGVEQDEPKKLDMSPTSTVASSPFMVSLTDVLSKGVSLTSSEFANEFVEVLLQCLPPPSAPIGYSAQPEFPPSLLQELLSDQQLDYALKSRYVLLYNAVLESMDNIFSHHSSFGRGSTTGAFTGASSRKKSMVSLLPPRPISSSTLKERVKAAVTNWTAYSEVYGENLDTMLIEEVKQDEDDWKDLEFELELVRENTFQEILEDVVQDTIASVERAAALKRAREI
ncbi:hypothetical protein HDU79_004058 [Rhizoclosmatium sp. JEL0117]|nr:hypothetical protein HDU79_004058 [Rhizoclosmatium sp. JEL0117]